MNTKRILLSFVIVFVVAIAYEFLVYGGILFSFHEQHKALLNPTPNTPRLILTTAFACALLTVFYALFARGGAARLSTGIVYGIFMGFLAGWIPYVYDKLILADYPFYLAWSTAGFVKIFLIGIVLGVVYRNAPPPASTP